MEIALMDFDQADKALHPSYELLNQKSKVMA
jgi:hypothetical protein